MKYKALPIKNWIISQISTMGWTMVITRALPELYEANHKFTIVRINRIATWTELEYKIIAHYLRRMYKLEIPEDIQDENSEMILDYWDLVKFDFFDLSSVASKIRTQVTGFASLFHL